eukprot:939258-Amorphochlora_amoeboformis.AAC.1
MSFPCCDVSDFSFLNPRDFAPDAMDEADPEILRDFCWDSWRFWCKARDSYDCQDCAYVRWRSPSVHRVMINIRDIIELF